MLIVVDFGWYYLLGINFLLPATSSTPISVNSNINYNNPLILYIGKSKQNLKQKNTSIQK